VHDSGDLHHILDQFWNKLTRDLEGFRRGEQGGAIQDVANHIDRDGYMLHSYAGGFKCVPADWRFPRCGVFDLWQQWWIGDLVRQVSPLRYLSIKDMNHLDDVQVGPEEMHGQTGKRKNN